MPLNIDDIRLTQSELAKAWNYGLSSKDNVSALAHIANTATDKAIREIAKRLDEELDCGENTPTICRNIHHFMIALKELVKK